MILGVTLAKGNSILVVRRNTNTVRLIRGIVAESEKKAEDSAETSTEMHDQGRVIRSHFSPHYPPKSSPPLQTGGRGGPGERRRFVPRSQQGALTLSRPLPFSCRRALRLGGSFPSRATAPRNRYPRMWPFRPRAAVGAKKTRAWRRPQSPGAAARCPSAAAQAASFSAVSSPPLSRSSTRFSAAAPICPAACWEIFSRAPLSWCE